MWLAVALVAAGVAAVGLHAATNIASPAEATTTDPSQGNADAPDFDNPLVQGVRVNSLGAAASKLSFTPLVPLLLGDPFRISLHHESAYPENDILALVYQHAIFGRFVVTEQPSPMTEQELEGMAASCHPDTGCEGSWSVVPLADGTRALRIGAPEISNGFVWIHRGFLFDVFGPGASFSADTAETVANLFSAVAVA